MSTGRRPIPPNANPEDYTDIADHGRAFSGIPQGADGNITLLGCYGVNRSIGKGRWDSFKTALKVNVALRLANKLWPWQAIKPRHVKALMHTDDSGTFDHQTGNVREEKIAEALAHTADPNF